MFKLVVTLLGIVVSAAAYPQFLTVGNVYSLNSVGPNVDLVGPAQIAGASPQSFFNQGGHGGGLGEGMSGSAANAGASTQPFFNQGGHGGGLGEGMSGSAANAGASTQPFTQGGHGRGFGLGMSGLVPGISTESFSQGGLSGGLLGSISNTATAIR